jgi:hypothetical protein
MRILISLVASRLDRRLLIVAWPRAPHLFQVVKLTDFGSENMNDHISGVYEYPVATGHAFYITAAITLVFKEAYYVIRKS